MHNMLITYVWKHHSRLLPQGFCRIVPCKSHHRSHLVPEVHLLIRKLSTSLGLELFYTLLNKLKALTLSWQQVAIPAQDVKDNAKRFVC